MLGLRRRQIGMHRDGQHLGAGALGLGQVARLSAEPGEAGLQVQRRRIVNFGLDLALAEKFSLLSVPPRPGVFAAFTAPTARA